jgi:predicted alpha/beta superfamily hydrolase
MHDGQNLFDPSTSFTGYDWKVDEIAAGMIEQKLIEEIIVVGIYNTKERIEEYNYFTPKGKKYANFIIKELKNFIDENFRTIAKASQTALMGSSMGGLISFQLFWNFPKIFGKAACLSNSFWVNDGEIFNMVENTENIFNEKNRLYLDCGSGEKELINDFSKMVELISSMEIGNNNFYHYVEENGNHSEYDWAKRLHKPLKYLFGKNH